MASTDVVQKFWGIDPLGRPVITGSGISIRQTVDPLLFVHSTKTKPPPKVLTMHPYPFPSTIIQYTEKFRNVG